MTSPATGHATPAPAPVTGPPELTHGCVRCGARIPLAESMCERCNPLGLRAPAASQSARARAIHSFDGSRSITGSIAIAARAGDLLHLPSGALSRNLLRQKRPLRQLPPLRRRLE